MKSKALFAGIAVLSFIGQSQLHAQATWTSSTAGGDWASANAWTIGGSPGSLSNNGTTALIFDTATANRVYTNTLTNFTASTITVNSGSMDNTVTGSQINLGGTFTVNTGSWQTFGLGMDLGAVRTFTVNAGQLTLSGNLTGASGGISKAGGSPLIISGNNSLGASERLNITSSSTVYLDSTAALGAAGGAIRFGNGVNAVLSIRSDNAINSYNLTGGSSGNSGMVTLGRQNSGAAYSQAFGILELGSRTMTFNQGSNISSGTMLASINELRMTAGNNDRPVILNGSATINVGSASITSSALTKRLQLDGTSSANSIGAISNGISGATIELIKDNSSSTWALIANNSYTGSTTITAGTLQLGNGGITGSISTSSAITNNATLAFNRSNTITQGTDFAATISGTGVLRKSGAGNLILNGANLGTGSARETLSFSGSNSGTVTLKNTAALGAAGNSARFSGAGSGVLDLQADTSVNAYNIVSGTFNGGTLIANRATSGTSISHTLGVLDLSSVTMTINKGGNVTGTAAVSFTELKMSGGNNYSPVTLAGDADIAIGSASITNNGMLKQLQLDGTSQSNTIGVISDTNNGTTGTLLDPTKVNLIKANSSTWTLNGTSTYTGTTTIKGGTLKLNTSTSIASSPTITVGDAGSSGAVLDVTTAGFTVGSTQTLGGIGTIFATGKTVTASGTISPGNSAGILTIDGGILALDGTTDFIFELGSSSDRINLINSASLNLGLNTIGLADFLFSNSGGFGEGVYTLISGASAFSGALDASNLTGDVLGFDSTLSMSGNNLILTVVPEPGAALLGSLGMLALLRRRRIG